MFLSWLRFLHSSQICISCKCISWHDIETGWYSPFNEEKTKNMSEVNLCHFFNSWHRHVSCCLDTKIKASFMGIKCHPDIWITYINTVNTYKSYLTIEISSLNIRYNWIMWNMFKYIMKWHILSEIVFPELVETLTF